MQNVYILYLKNHGQSREQVMLPSHKELKPQTRVWWCCLQIKMLYPETSSHLKLRVFPRPSYDIIHTCNQWFPCSPDSVSLSNPVLRLNTLKQLNSWSAATDAAFHPRQSRSEQRRSEVSCAVFLFLTLEYKWSSEGDPVCPEQKSHPSTFSRLLSEQGLLSTDWNQKSNLVSTD